MFYKSNILTAFPIHSSAESKVGAVGSIPPPGPTGVDLYSRFAFAGAVCCSVTHGALTPVDVVKTRIQLEPEVYNKVRLSLMSTLSVFVASRSLETLQTCATEAPRFSGRCKFFAGFSNMNAYSSNVVLNCSEYAR